MIPAFVFASLPSFVVTILVVLAILLVLRFLFHAALGIVKIVLLVAIGIAIYFGLAQLL